MIGLLPSRTALKRVIFLEREFREFSNPWSWGAMRVPGTSLGLLLALGNVVLAGLDHFGEHLI